MSQSVIAHGNIPTSTTTPPTPNRPTSSSASSRYRFISGRLLTWIGSTIPGIVVFGLMAGTFYLGHLTDWKLPSLGTLLRQDTPVAQDWCPEHLVPESQCVECKPELMPRPKEHGWCSIHGVAECVICHPELAQVKGAPLLPGYDTAKAITVRQRPENNSRSTLHKSRLQFASDETVQKIGLDVDVVATSPMQDALTANGEIAFDPTHVAHLAPRTAGTVWSVSKKLGDPVVAGEVLAIVDSAAVGQAKTQLVQAIVEVELRHKNMERLKKVGDAIAGRQLLEAEIAAKEANVSLVAARQALVNLGFTIPRDLLAEDADRTAEQLRFLGLPSSLAQSSIQTQSTNLLPVTSPIDGVIVASDVVAGEVVAPDKPMFTVADPSRMWLTLRLRAEDARYAIKGLQVRFSTAEDSQTATGIIDWIAPTMDPRTRTVELRIIIDNSSGTLRDGSYGSGRIILREEPNAIVVPTEAIQSTGDVTVVFVRDKHYFDKGAPKVFHVRQVRLGARDDKNVELLAGVLPGEVIATKGSNVLLSQLLRSNLGAGCGCHTE